MAKSNSSKDVSKKSQAAKPSGKLVRKTGNAKAYKAKFKPQRIKLEDVLRTSQKIKIINGVEVIVLDDDEPNSESVEASTVSSVRSNDFSEDGNSPERVVLVPYPLQGHISPMLDLGSALHSRGFSITIMHIKYNSPNPLNHPNFTFFPINNSLTDSDVRSLHPETFNSTINIKSQAPLEEGLIKIMGNESVACIISDALMYAMDDVIEHLKLPRIIFHTCSVASIAAFTELPRLTQEGYSLLEGNREIFLQFDPLPLRNHPV